MKITTAFTFDKVDFSKENDIHAVITLKAPKIDWEKKRAPICIIPVIDVSGSMSGDKLEYAKQSVIKLIDHLAPGDYCGLVAFESNVHPIAEPRELSQGNRDALKTKVGQLQVAGSTNFSGGMRQALEWVNKLDVSSTMVLRVIMFTDGQANAGEAVGRDMIPLCKKLLGKGTLSAFGFGQDCDQDLLADIAREGKGNYAFIRNPDDALTAFAKELGGLLSMYGQNIVIDVAPHNGHKIEEVLSDVDVEEDGDKVKIKIPEILSEEERHIVLRVKTSIQSKVLPRELNVLDIKVDFDELKDGEKKHICQEMKTKLAFVDASDAQKDPTNEVMAIVAVALTVQAQIKAEELAKQGNFTGASAMLSANAVKLDSFNLHDHAGMSRGLGASYSSPVAYATSGGLRNSMKNGMTRSAGTSDNEAADILCSVGLQASTSSQASAVASFTAGHTVTPVGQQVKSQFEIELERSRARQLGPDVSMGGVVAGSLVVPAAPAEVKQEAKKVSVSKKKSKRW